MKGGMGPSDTTLFQALDEAYARDDFNERTWKGYKSNLSFWQRTLSRGSGSITTSIVEEPVLLWGDIVNKYDNVHTRRHKMAIVKTALAYDKGLGDIHTRAFWDRSFRMADRDARLDKANNLASKRELDSMPDLTHLREVACALADGADSTYKRSLERLWMLIAAGGGGSMGPPGVSWDGPPQWGAPGRGARPRTAGRPTRPQSHSITHADAWCSHATESHAHHAPAPTAERGRRFGHMTPRGQRS